MIPWCLRAIFPAVRRKEELVNALALRQRTIDEEITREREDLSRELRALAAMLTGPPVHIHRGDRPR